mgnify:CR=1 FL=1
MIFEVVKIWCLIRKLFFWYARTFCSAREIKSLIFHKTIDPPTKTTKGGVSFINNQAQSGPRIASVNIMIPTNAEGVVFAPTVINMKPNPTWKKPAINPKNISFRDKINYNLNQIGSDRIANYAYVYSRKIKNCIIVDFGTATTFDVVTKNVICNGGVIAPGVNLSIKSLTRSADQIPVFSIKKQKKIIGKNTIQALNSGFYWGYTGLINNIILKIEKETKKKYKVRI